MKNAPSARRGLVAVLAAGVVMVSSLVTAAPASAAESPTERPPQACNYHIETGATVCVPLGEDLYAAVLRQTGVLVSVPAGARGATPRPASAETAAITTATVQGELDDDVNFGGSYLTITNANFCDGSTVYQIGNLATLGFNDKTSSFIGYANCTMKIWENAGFTGASLGYAASSANVGPAMNDRASSVQLR